MSERKTATTLTPEEIQAVAGGSCSYEDLQRILEDLKKNYEALIDFTSYVIERVAGPGP